MFGKFGGVFFRFVSESVLVAVPPFFESIRRETDIVVAVFVFVFTYVALVDDLAIEAISIQRT